MTLKISLWNRNVPKPITTSVALFLILQLSFITAQKLCLSSKKEVPSNNIIFVESFSASKCMRTEGFGILPDSKVVLAECLHRTKLGKDQQFRILTTPMNKIILQQDVGRGENYCLVTSNSRDELQNTLCNTKNMGQSWTLKPVKNQPGQFLIEQFSSKKCLTPKTRSTGSVIQLTSCNAYQTEQIWKILYSNPASNTSSPVIPC